MARIRRGEKVDHFETIRRAKNGNLLKISLTISPIRDVEGRIVGASKVARDVTERKRMEEEQNRLFAAEKAAREKAEEANRLKDEFLAAVSHELRNPLNSIMGWASLLNERRLSSERAARATETILRNAQSLSQLISDLLDVSRIVSGRLRLNLQSCDPVSAIESATEIARPAAEAKGMRIQTMLDPSSGVISGDPERLQQIIGNLLSNAIKFTPSGGRIQVRLERVASHVEIIVSDSGIGIDPELMPFIFDRFRQADATSTRQESGLGLGLAIVRHLVELHGGTVTARSAGLGLGAEFVVQLPIMAVTQVQETNERMIGYDGAGPESATGLPSLAGLRLLVVDDEADARELVAAILTQAGAEVAPVSSAGAALLLVPRWKPNVLISDIGMPGEDGYVLIRKLRALSTEQGGDMPAIALTAFARPLDRLRLLTSGYQMHVAKPVDPVELVTIVASTAGRFRTRGPRLLSRNDGYSVSLRRARAPRQNQASHKDGCKAARFETMGVVGESSLGVSPRECEPICSRFRADARLTLGLIRSWEWFTPSRKATRRAFTAFLP